MKCPACFNPLVEVQVGNLKVDVCRGGCGGVWFDAFELQRADEEDEVVGEPLLHLERDPRINLDLARKRECPRCAGVKLHRHFLSAQRRVEVDQCPNCSGYWLDAGELEQVRAENSEAARSKQARKSSLSAEDIRYLYRLQAQEGQRPDADKP